jgi:hypothetical protein
MNHPSTLAALSQSRHSDHLRETSGTWRVQRDGTVIREPLIAHPRLVTAAVALLVAFVVIF